MPKAKVHSGAAKRFKKDGCGLQAQASAQKPYPHQNDNQAQASVAWHQHS